jgi:hypothetical protein
MKEKKTFYVFFNGSFEVKANTEREALDLAEKYLNPFYSNFDYDSLEVEEEETDEDEEGDTDE